jgi:cardiolipin synthase
MKLDWTEGNRFTLLENGEEFYPRVFEAIAQARQEVLLETFILFDDKVGRELQRALLQAAGNGAEVNVLVDGWGTPDLGTDYLRPLADAGVEVRAFDPAPRLFGLRLNLFRRMHRKLVVVDGAIAFVGGINYSIDHLAEFGPKAKQDYAVCVEGPLVEQIREFCRASVASPEPPRASWLQRWRQRRQGNVSTKRSAGTASAAFVTRDNASHRSDIERQYRAALRRARQRVVIANAYFFPGFIFLRELRRAARRGVEVKLILQGEPDMAFVRTAASALHANLIRAGVKVYEYCQRPLHGKVATIDDEWATVGSSNLDPLSLGLNLEANVVMRDREFATQLRERLDKLIAQHCRKVELPAKTLLSSMVAPIRGFFVYHIVRSFPQWLRWLPKSEQSVSQLRPVEP